MCKLMMMSGLNPKNADKNWEFVFAMGVKMSGYNRDGLGYAAVGTKGQLFGERWTKNEDAFRDRNKFSQPIPKSKLDKLKAKYGDMIELEDESSFNVVTKKYGEFGEYEKAFTAITLHTRMATSPKTYNNTHPFVDAALDTSLIHNGVISNVTKDDNIRSTCDSERILNKYLEHEVMKVPADIQNAVDGLKGNFACGIFSRDASGVRILDIFKSRAQLNGLFIKELDTMVFSTDSDDIKAVCKKLGFTILSKSKWFKEDTLVRFNAETGEKILEIGYKDNARFDSYNGNNYTEYSRNHDDEEWCTATYKWRKKADLEKERADRAAKLNEWNKKQADKNAKLIEDKSSERKVDGVMVSEAEWQKFQAKKTQVVDRLTDDQLAEYMECRKTGMSVDEALEYLNVDLKTDNKDVILTGLTSPEQVEFNELLGKGFTADEAIGKIISDIDSTKDLIAKNVSDNLNENEAADADYYRSKDQALWQKRFKN